MWIRIPPTIVDDRNIRRFERATRAQTFGRDNAADFASGSKAATLFADLGPILAKLTETRVGQAQAIMTRLDAAILNKYRAAPDKPAA